MSNSIRLKSFYGFPTYTEHHSPTDNAVQRSDATHCNHEFVTAAVSTAASASVADDINDGTTAIAPSQNAVFDALALKAPIDAPNFTGTVVGVTKAMVGLQMLINTSDC